MTTKTTTRKTNRKPTKENTVTATTWTRIKNITVKTVKAPVKAAGWLGRKTKAVAKLIGRKAKATWAWLSGKSKAAAEAVADAAVSAKNKTVEVAVDVKNGTVNKWNQTCNWFNELPEVFFPTLGANHKPAAA